MGPKVLSSRDFDKGKVGETLSAHTREISSHLPLICVLTSTTLFTPAPSVPSIEVCFFLQIPPLYSLIASLGGQITAEVLVIHPVHRSCDRRKIRALNEDGETKTKSS